jgi:hypothetical protein
VDGRNIAKVIQKNTMQIKRYKIQRIALYIYFFSLNFEIFNFMGLGSTARLTGFIYMAAILPQIKHFIKTSYILPYLQSIFLFFALLTLMSLININTYSYNFFDTSILLNILFFWFLINHERKDPGVLLKGMLSFALGSIFLAALYNMGIGIEYSGGRVTIFDDNANAIALRLSISIIVLIYLVVSNNFPLKRWRYLLLLPIPLMTNFMMQTGSRKALIALALAFIIGTLLYKTKHIFYKVLIIGISGFVAFYFIQALMESEVLYQRLTVAAEGNIGGREYIWGNLIKIIKENPIFGIGKTGYREAYIQIAGTAKSPHNVILEVAAYTGIIGLMLYLWFLYKSSWQAFLSYKKNKYLLPLLLLIPVYAMIMGGQALNGKIPWAVLALAASTIFYTKNITVKPL